MRSILGGLGACALVFLAGASFASAQTPATADIIGEALYAGTLDDGLDALAPRVEAGETAARFGQGMLVLAGGIERYVAAHIHHGFDPVGGIGAIPMLGLAAPQVDGQGTVAPLDYETYRSLQADFVADLDRARDLFADAAIGEPFVVPLDVASIRLDFNGNGTVEKSESVGALLLAGARVLGETPMGELSGAGTPSTGVPVLRFGFDNADAAWLAGYASVLATQADFLLAHDFSRTFDAVFHRLFPKAGLPLALPFTPPMTAGGGMMFDAETDRLLADMISAIHTLDWPIVERSRFDALPGRLAAILEFSRLNWSLIRSETDDNAELLPNPQQTPPEGAPPVSEAMIESWLETLAVAEDILAGDLLIPHWRFSDRGFDLSAYFEGAERTDIVMLLTGLDALPYLREGPIAEAGLFEDILAPFGDDFLGFALWFN